MMNRRGFLGCLAGLVGAVVVGTSVQTTAIKQYVADYNSLDLAVQPDRLVAGMFLRVEGTNEIMLITNVESETTISVKRCWRS